MGNIIWLASYPKSGNTWLRIFLNNYLANRSQPVSINSLDFGWLASTRERFDEDVGISSADLTPREIDFYRPAFHKYLSARLEKPTFIKVHDAYTCNNEGELLFPATATAGVIYLVRNPLDVAVSYAHHSRYSIERIVHEMNREEATLARSENSLVGSIHQRLLSWSQHVRSWTQQTSLPLHIVRYEDMMQAPVKTFSEIVKFAQLPLEQARLARSLSFSSFDKLKEQEKAAGFKEKFPRSTSFFRRGKVNDWQTKLTAAEASVIISHHKEIMQQFNYGDMTDDNANRPKIDSCYSYSAHRDYSVQRA